MIFVCDQLLEIKIKVGRSFGLTAGMVNDRWSGTDRR